MTKMIINIDWMDRNFGAAPKDQRIACVASARTLDEVKSEIVEAVKFHLEGMEAQNIAVPEEYAGGWEPEFELTARAQLRYSDNYITRKALARETGINEQQLSHYANGWKVPRPGTRKRIEDGIRSISRRLTLIV